MRIGELARRTGVPATAIRYYERAGVLPPPRRTASGYRSYEAAALRRIEFIKAAQAVGLTIAEVREVIAIRDGGTPPCRHVIDLVEARRTEISARISSLQALERELARVTSRGVALDPATCDPSSVCGVIPPRVGTPDPP